MLRFLGKFLDSNEKEIKKLEPFVEKVNGFDQNFRKLTDEEIKAKTSEYKVRLSHGETLDNLLPEAFALVREAAGRAIGERHFDVQIMAATALHQGKIAEQKTGEGKTLSAAPALYLNALTGKGVHLVTVNDYLARRDTGWMGPIFNSLGISCAAIIHDESFIYDPLFIDKNVTDWRLEHLKPVGRREAYLADVTYGINSEYGFDYLRDNMASDEKDIVQRDFYYAVVDEVDSVLIDEARTPHIISAPDSEPTQKYYEYAQIVERLTPKLDFTVDEKLHTAALTEHGLAKLEKMMGLGNIYEQDFQTVHHIEAALKAKSLFIRDKDYVVKDNQVIIVDEFTGRLMFGRRFSEGIHQAIEAKEKVTIQQESKTLATVSLQNYFRKYEKLAGMTGTAATEAEEFHKIYNLDVVSIPTNKAMIRRDLSDMVYKTGRAKFGAVVHEIEEAHKIGQPVLVGTTSIEKNEIIGEFLKHKGIPHNLLNAKNHLQEATIISDAGKRGSVTVATNMAGRGVDIVLGGTPPNKYAITDKNEYEKLFREWRKNHDEIINLGGLYVIGTERHESRRIDNQLRGRSGRQGDPGMSRFFVALDDDIMRLFGGDQVARLMTAFKLPEDQPLEHPMVSRAIEQAQVKVEGFNFDIRKHLVDYDDVMNKQREIIYKLRRKVLEVNSSTKSSTEDESFKKLLKDDLLEKMQNEITNLVKMYAPEGYTEPERDKIVQEFITIIPFDQNSQQQLITQLQQLHMADEITEFLLKVITDIYTQREQQISPEIMRQIEKWVMLQVIDTLWMDHLDAMDDLREGIGLRGYGQRDPLVEYKAEAFSMFEKLMVAIDYEVVHRIFKVQVQLAPQMQSTMPKNAVTTPAGQSSVGGTAGVNSVTSSTQTVSHSTGIIHKKLGRNDPCWCGSGKKWKRCHYPQSG